MTEADLLDQVIRQAELSCLGFTEALQDVCSKVFIMVRLRQKHHSRIHRGGILAATESPMVPEVASCDEAVAVNSQLHVVRALMPTFQEQPSHRWHQKLLPAMKRLQSTHSFTWSVHLCLRSRSNRVTDGTRSCFLR